MTSESARLPGTGAQARALAASYSNFLIATTSSLIVTPIFLHALGPAQYGLWLTVSSWLAYLSLSNAGFPQATQNRAAQAHAQKRYDDVATALIAAAWATAALALIFIAISVFVILVGAMMSPSFRGTLEAHRAVLPILALTAAAYLVSAPAEQFRAVLRGSHKVALAQMTAAGGVVAAAAAGLVAVWLQPTVLAFAFSQASATVAIALVSVATTVSVVRRSGARVHLRHVTSGEVRSLLSPSFHFLLISLAGALIWSTDNLIIAWRLGAAEVAPYAVSLRITTICSSIVSALALTLLPSVTMLWTTHDVQRLRALSLLATRVIIAISAFLAVELILVGRAFILRWAGTDALAPRSTFYLFVAIFLVRAVAQSMELIVVGVSRHQSYALVALLEGVLNLCLSLVLVRHVGSFGVALGTLLAHLLGTGWFLPWWAMRTLGMRPLALRRSAAATLSAALVAWLSGATVAAALPPLTLVSLVVVSATVAAVYAGAYACIGLTPAERYRFAVIARQHLTGTVPR